MLMPGEPGSGPAQRAHRAAGAAAGVSFCMIVRNGAATLADCLGSVAHLADEMIVVDTGSSDASCQIARGFGARVVSLPWPDDFAAARNRYLELARMPWVLSLDADEQLAPIDGAVFRTALRDNPRTAFVFTIRNYLSAAQFP